MNTTEASRLLRRGILPCAVLFLCGCASAPPPWHRGHLDTLNEYYDQGTGGGSTRTQADRNARIALLGYRAGIRIGNLTEDRVQSYARNGDEVTVELLTSKGVEQVAGTLPPGTLIAERWQDGSGSWWSYSVLEKPGAGGRLQARRDRRLEAARLRSAVPGWSQFTKGERRKGMRILTAGGIGLTGLGTCAILQADFEARRDRVAGTGARARDDRGYYDGWANRFYWGALAGGALAAVTYVYSLVDGLTHVPPTYKLLLGTAGLKPGPLLALRYEFD